METEIKKVSVVMCTYNGACYIREQLDSILNQTYPIYELIVQDDCSTDGTVEIVEEYQTKYPQVSIKIYVNEKNSGFNRNFLTAIQKAEGEYIAIADQDDIWYEYKIEKQIMIIGDKDLCCSAYHVGENYSDSTKHLLSPLFNAERLIFVNTIPGHTMLIRRSFFMQLNNLSEHIYYDWWLAVFASLNNSIVKVELALSWHRIHGKSAIGMIRKTYVKKEVTKPTYQPYLYGLRNLTQLKKKKAWTLFYSAIVHSDDANDLVRKIASLQLRSDYISLLRFCVLCLKNNRLIYPNLHKGNNRIRGFFYPFIFSYNNCCFNL